MLFQLALPYKPCFCKKGSKPSSTNHSDLALFGAKESRLRKNDWLSVDGRYWGKLPSISPNKKDKRRGLRIEGEKKTGGGETESICKIKKQGPIRLCWAEESVS